ncbi:MAG TPA: glycosyltransferase [Gemmatimonadales bacterium]|nr:glycosyltransferase [Gemmatimonadales bacterium]
MDDVRWFASNAHTALVVPELRRLGLRIATEGGRPARVAVAMSGHVGADAWRFARRCGARLLLYLWDLPPTGMGSGRPDHVWWVANRFLRVPRLWNRYHRGGHFSVLRYIARRSEDVWVPSRITQQSVAERFGVQGREVPYCYDSNRFIQRAAAARRTSHDGPLTLVTVSRLRRHKNQAAVIRAATLVDRAVRVRLIGRGPQRDNLEALASRLRVSCSIETDADDATVTRAYQEASVAVCPSRFEGFGLTPIEAIASGVPVVASDIPPHREFVGTAATLTPPDDPVALATAIIEAAEAEPADPSLVADLTIEAAAARFLNHLRCLLE